jgi:hypothetical protein
MNPELGIDFPHGMLESWFNHRYPLKHLKKLLYLTPGERARMAGAAQECFQQRFPIDAVARTLSAIVEGDSAQRPGFQAA